MALGNFYALFHPYFADSGKTKAILAIASGKFHCKIFKAASIVCYANQCMQ
jgi:hypothetical protein